ncbi:ABC transporter substrate-binding protein [Facklamia miroungae]|uniref:Putative spermidine/putrescine transport system substrate-binding protein n=1 Tax=Facklamia miroungae TaxID=120956 RepID=A0A1G7QN27_9LACT|nr:ABC transporter substrate-binding protein [Facklamia miroungae]NKZ29001.1 ABC transporter substrate-binding protein [Facklamia miroungae]SDF99883.1 putative spermidine/putrescine transport system substrate-binding protein [Facklamia miroungae]
MKKCIKILSISFLLSLVFNLTNVFAEEAEKVKRLSFEEMIELAKGSQVNFYGWGGDEKLNQWLDEVYGVKLKEKYDITLNRIPMDIDQILSQLVSEKQAKITESEIDMIWINGENFKSARENDLLFGPFTEKLPNYIKYIDRKELENIKDFGFPIEGYEAPYSKAQLVLIKDSAITQETPKNAEELLRYAKENPGMFTYPALPDFTGSAFVRNIIYQFVDYQEFQNMDVNKEKLKEVIKPALDYLKELSPYLWNQGKTYPSDGPALNNLFMDEEVNFYITYTANEVADSIKDGTYPSTAQSFIFDKGTVGNTNYIAIGKNSANKAAAIVAINEMLSPDMQLSKYEHLGLIPVIDDKRIDDQTKVEFKALENEKGTIPQDELLAKRLPEMPAQLIPLIEEIWLEEVAGN